MKTLFFFIISIFPVILSGQNTYDELIYFYPFNEAGNILVADATGNNFTGTLNDVQNTTDRFGNTNSAKLRAGPSLT